MGDNNVLGDNNEFRREEGLVGASTNFITPTSIDSPFLLVSQAYHFTDFGLHVCYI
jgi:hypothetical protein